jgi:hypothetical protein
MLRGGHMRAEVEVSAEAKGGVMEADSGARRRPRLLLGGGWQAALVQDAKKHEG